MTDFSDLTTDFIIELISDHERDLAEYRAELNRRKSDEILKMRAELEAKAAALGVSLSDVLNSKNTRAPAVPKYRNPNDPTQTWTGRGKAPAWINDMGRDSCLIPVEG